MGKPGRCDNRVDKNSVFFSASRALQFERVRRVRVIGQARIPRKTSDDSQLVETVDLEVRQCRVESTGVGGANFVSEF